MEKILKFIIMNLRKIRDSRVNDGKFKNALVGGLMGLSTLGGMQSCGTDTVSGDDDGLMETVESPEQKAMKENERLKNGSYSIIPNNMKLINEHTRGRIGMRLLIL